MNVELSDIRKIRNYSQDFDHKPERIGYNRMSNGIIALNENIAELYKLQRQKKININTFVEKFTENIYIILNLFNMMGVYPDYFYDKIVQMNIKYRKIVDDNSLRGNYGLLHQTGLLASVAKDIREGMEKGYYRIKAYPKKDMNDFIVEMIGLFEAYGIKHGIYSEEQCHQAFDNVSFNHQRIMEQLANSDDIYEDIECLCRLLFEYNTFFVSLGINPKECLEKYIADVEKRGSKGK